MSDVTQAINDQRNVNESSRTFDATESVDRRQVVNTQRQFTPVPEPNPRYRNPDPSQYPVWRPQGRPPTGYPPRFVPRNAEAREFQRQRSLISPLRTQEYQNRRSFEKPDRFDIDSGLEESRIRPTSPWQRIRDRLPDAKIALQNSNERDMDSTSMDRMIHDPSRDRLPPNYRRESVNAEVRKIPQDPRRYQDEDDMNRGFAGNPDARRQSVVQAEIARRDGEPRVPFESTMRRPSLTQQVDQNYNDRIQNPPKTRPLQAVPEYENRNQFEERLREDQNRNFRPDGYRELRKFGDMENTTARENRKPIIGRSEDEIMDESRTMTMKYQPRTYENSSYNLDNAQEFIRGRREMNINKSDLNGPTTERNGVVKDKNPSNETKTVQEKKPTPNGDIKPPSSLPQLKKEKSALKTPTKKISPKSPEVGSNNSLGEKKKVPMNKIQVGSAPSPNLKVVRSKIGSLENYTHKPGGGKVKIENRKLEWKAQPRIEAKNDKYAPSGGEKKITQVKLQWSAKSKIGSLENATHKPGGGDKKIETVKLDFKDKAKPKVGSKDNIKHVPGGGTVKKTTDADAKSISSDIEEQKLDIKAQSKVGSLDNVKYKPGGGDKKIFDDKEYLKQTTLTNESSKANSVTTSGSQVTENPPICSKDTQQKEKQFDDHITPISTSEPSKKKDEESSEKNKKQPSTPKKSLAEKNATSNLSIINSNDSKSITVQKSAQKLDTTKDDKKIESSTPKKSLTNTKEMTDKRGTEVNDMKSASVEKQSEVSNAQKDKKSELSQPKKSSDHIKNELKTKSMELGNINSTPVEKSPQKSDTRKDKKSEPSTPKKSLLEKKEILDKKYTEINDKKLATDKSSETLDTQKNKKSEPSTPKKSILENKEILDKKYTEINDKKLATDKSSETLDTQKNKKSEPSTPKKSILENKEILDKKYTEINDKKLATDKSLETLDIQKDKRSEQMLPKKFSDDKNDKLKNKSTDSKEIITSIPVEKSLLKSDTMKDKKSEPSTPKKSQTDKNETLQTKTITNPTKTSSILDEESSPKLGAKKIHKIESQNERTINKATGSETSSTESPSKEKPKDKADSKNNLKTKIPDKPVLNEEKSKLSDGKSPLKNNNEGKDSPQKNEKCNESKKEEVNNKTENVNKVDPESANKIQMKPSSNQNLGSKYDAQVLPNACKPIHEQQKENSIHPNSTSVSEIKLSTETANETKPKDSITNQNITNLFKPIDNSQTCKTNDQNLKHEHENKTCSSINDKELPKTSDFQEMKFEAGKQSKIETSKSQQNDSKFNKTENESVEQSLDKNIKSNLVASAKPDIKKEISNPNSIVKNEKERKSNNSCSENPKSEPRANSELTNITADQITTSARKSVPLEASTTKSSESNETKIQNSNTNEPLSKNQQESTLSTSPIPKSK